MDKYTVIMIDGTMDTVTAKDKHEAEVIINKKYHKGIIEIWKEVENGNGGTKKGNRKV